MDLCLCLNDARTSNITKAGYILFTKQNVYYLIWPFFLLGGGEWRVNYIQSPKQTAEKYPVSCSYLPSLIEISRRFRSAEPVGLFFVYQKKEKEFCLFIFIPFCSDYYKAAVQSQLWEPTPIRDIKKKTTTTKTIAYKTGHKLSNIFKCARHWNATMDECSVFYYFSICTFKGQTDGQQQQPIILSHTKGEETEGHLSTSEILSFHERRGE